MSDSSVFRKINRILLFLGLLLLVAVLLIGIISAAVNWQGICESGTAGPEPCSWIQFALREMFWGIFLFIPYFFIAALINLVIALSHFVASLVTKIRSRR